MPKISIIVPVYNVERYLDKCLESLLNQTIKDIEIILVNDGSTDSSGEICEKYRWKDSRIVLIQQENAGVSAARNTGLFHAKGDCVGFVDPDDWVEPAMFEKMHGLIERENSDLCLCSFAVHKNGKSKLAADLLDFEKWIDHQGKVKKALLLDMIGSPDMNIGSKTIMGSVCRMLVKRSLIETHGLRFEPGLSYMEDTLFFMGALLKSEKISLTAEALYHYVLRGGSATQKYRPRFLEELKRIHQIMQETLEREGALAEEFLHRLNNRYIHMSILAIMNECKIGNEKRMADRLDVIREVCSDPKLRKLIGEMDITAFTLRRKMVFTSILHNRILPLLIYYTAMNRYKRFFEKITGRKR